MEKYAQPFQAHQALLREVTLDTFKKSPEYAGIVQQWDKILLLADRILVACDKHLELDKVPQIGSHLDQLATVYRKHGEQELEVAQLLLKDLEIWLKAIFFLTLPEEYRKMQTDGQQNINKFNLFQTIVSLGLLPEEEIRKLSATDWYKIADPVRQKILCAKEDRNPDLHDTKELPYEVNQRLLGETLVSLLAPLHKHYAALQNALQGLITRRFELGDLSKIMRTVESERQSHLEQFGARRTVLQALTQRLREEAGQRYLLLTGVEGIGKSATCARLSEILASPARPVGAHASEARKLTPWLPGALLFHGKQSNRVEEIVRLLLEQGNAMLLSPISVPTVQSWGEIGQSWGVMDAEEEKMYRNLMEKLPPQLFRMLPSDQKASNLMAQYRGALYEMLEDLVSERGQAVLLLDATEEISPDGEDLAFLPEHLPQGASALLTGRPSTTTVQWLKDNRPVAEIGLTAFERPEISEILDIGDEETAARQFNDKVFQKTDGMPVFVSKVKRQMVLEKKAWADIVIDQDIHSSCKRQATKWQSLLLQQIRGLLTIFEPVTPLDLSLVQGFVERQGITITLPELRDSLLPVADQIQGLDADRIKLAIKPLAEYLKDKYYSNLDMERMLDNAVAWLAADDNATPKLMAAFLKHWADPQIAEKLRHKAEHMVTLLKEKKAARILGQIAEENWEAEGKQPDYVIDCLKTAAEWNDSKAMSQLGFNLVAGHGTTQNVEQGENWLRKAAATGEEDSICLLATRFLMGENIRKDWSLFKNGVTSAIRNSQEYEVSQDAAGSLDKNINIMLNSLANFFRAEISEDGEQIEIQLRQLASIGNVTCRSLLGLGLVTGDKLKQNIEEGEMWLRKAAEAEDSYAMYVLGSRLIEQIEFPQNVEEGERWLRKSVDAGNIASFVTLGYRFYKKGDRENAVLYFLQHFERTKSNSQEQIQSGNNLAYMLHRGEVPSDFVLPPVAELLAPGLQNEYAFALINHALCLAKGFQCQVDWEAADRVFATICGTADDFDWFCGLAQEGDAEGHLVVGWLARHNILADPEGYSVKKRMDLARQGGWQVPEWMNKKAGKRARKS